MAEGAEGRRGRDSFPARCRGDARAQPMGGRGGGGCAVLWRHLVGAKGRGSAGARPREGPGPPPARPEPPGPGNRAETPGDHPQAHAEASPPNPGAPSGLRAKVPSRLVRICGMQERRMRVMGALSSFWS